MSDARRSHDSGYLADDSEGYPSSVDPRYHTHAFPAAAAAGVGGGYQPYSQQGLYGGPVGPSARGASNYYPGAPQPPAGHSTTSPSHDMDAHPLGGAQGSSAPVSSADARARMAFMQGWAQGAAIPVFQSPGQSPVQSPGQSIGAPSAQRYNILQYSTPRHPATIAGGHPSSRPQNPVAPSAAALGASYSDTGPPGSARRRDVNAGAQSDYVQCTMPDCRGWYNASDVQEHIDNSCVRKCPRCGRTYAGMIGQPAHNKRYHPSDATMEAFLSACKRCLGTHSAHQRNCPMNNLDTGGSGSGSYSYSL